VIRHATLGEQNHPVFLGHQLWRCPGADQRFQLRFGGVINGKSSSRRKHVPIESRPVYIVNSYMGRDTSAAQFEQSELRDLTKGRLSPSAPFAFSDSDIFQEKGNSGIL
jgi:hypothetical protein